MWVDDPWSPVPGWPGLFRRLAHRVEPGARCLPLGGGHVRVAVCGALCWPPAGSGTVYPRCPDCSSARYHR